MRINLRLVGVGVGLLFCALPTWTLFHGDTLECACAVGVLMIVGVLIGAVAHAPALCVSQLQAMQGSINLPARVQMYKRLAQLPLGLLLLSISQGVIPSLAVTGLVISASALYGTIYLAEKALEVIRRDADHRCEHCAYPLRATARCSECGTLAPAFADVC